MSASSSNRDRKPRHLPSLNWSIEDTYQAPRHVYE
jgi:hypothetical protein